MTEDNEWIAPTVAVGLWVLLAIAVGVGLAVLWGVA